MSDTGLCVEEDITLLVRDSAPVSLSARVRLFIYGILMPVICVVSSFLGAEATIDEPWQDGRFATHIAMLLRPMVLACFAPWLLFSMTAMVTWLVRPRTIARTWVRLGLTTGAALAFQYWLFILITSGPVSPIAAALVMPAIFVLSWIARRAFRFQIWHLLLFTTAVAVVVVLLRVFVWTFFDFVLASALAVLASAPTANLWAYGRAAVLVYTQHRRERVRTPLVARWTLVAWLIGYGVSWRLAVQAMLTEYSRLPATNPNCYFANAAARASPRLVGRTYLSREGSVGITLTMQRLKFLELALLATAPGWHRRVRSLYDRLGRPAAGFCSRRRWFANLTCLALKPVEWLAEGVRLVAGVSDSTLHRIYRK